jgi:prepilin-type processing-associated H-X9-DG protein
MSLTPAQQQKVAQQEVEGVTSLLQAPLQYGTDKLLINVNGQNSKLPTNKNGIVKYTLEQPVKLEIGDKVTLIDSFVEERGLSIDTISFEEDVEEEMRFLYYIQGDCRNTQANPGTAPYTGLGADVEFTHFPNYYPDYFAPKGDINFDKGENGNFFSGFGIQPEELSGAQSCFPNPNYITTGQSSNASGFGNSEEVFKTTGANGQYYYMGEWWSPFPINDATNKYSWKTVEGTNEFNPNTVRGSQLFWRPTYGAAVIKIPAGNYSVSALSDLINNQLNGSLSNENTFNSNVLIDKLYRDTSGLGFIQSAPFFSGLTEPTGGEVESPSTYNPDVLIIGEDTHQPYQRRRGNIMTKAIIAPNIVSNIVNMQSIRGFATDSRPAATSNVLYADGHTKIAGVGTGVGRSDISTSTLGYNLDGNVYNGKQSAREQAKAFSTNCYLHLDGMTKLFETENYIPKTGGMTDIDKMPSLEDWFLGNIGDGGKFYLNQELSELNYQPSGASSNIYFWNQIEDLKWSMMFGVGSSSFGNIDGYSYGIGSIGGPQTESQQMAGTTSFSVSYDTQSANRFTITDLHEPYKLASTTPDGGSSTNLGGQQATNFNTPMDFNFASSINNVGSVRQLCGIYPIESVGGVAVSNFSFNTVKNTKVYKNLIQQIAAFNFNDNNGSFQMARERLIYELFTKPYDQFFDSPRAAKEAWSKTLWARLGFDYTQLGDVSNNLESIFTFTNESTSNEIITEPRIVKQKGIITHNDFDYTFIPSSDGLGLSNPYLTASSGAPPQSYGLRGYGISCNESDTGQSGVTANNIHILSNSKPINALNFPSLNNGNNYLIIESDIVKTNAKDSKSNSTTIVGIMSKENASNDTIYSVDPITFTVTQPKLLASIEVKIKNPDGSLVSDDIVGKNNGFIFSVEKALKPAEIPLMSI